MHFLEIISAGIVFKFGRYNTYVLTGGGEWAAMTFKGASKEAKRSHPPNGPKMAQYQQIPQYNKKTKQLLFIKDWTLLLVRP